MAPEVKETELRHTHYSMRVDVYAIGLLALNLVTKSLVKWAEDGIGNDHDFFLRELRVK